MGLLEKVPTKPSGDAGKTWPAIAMGFFVAFGGILFGYDTGTIGGILDMDYFKEHYGTFNDASGQFEISTSTKSAIVSILSAGTFFGSLFSPVLADRLGRRPALMISTWVFNLGVILQTASTSNPLFLAGRFFAGFGVGLVSALIPLYQSETAPKWIRGAIVGAYQFAITIGLLLAAVVDNSTHDRTDTSSYRIPIAVQFAWSLILFFGMMILPETPRYLIRAKRMDKAAKALGYMRRLPEDHPVIHDELHEIKASYEHEMRESQHTTILDCFKPPILKRQLTGCGLQALQQLTGINFIFYYGTTYFRNAQVGSPFTITMITSAVNVGSTIPGLYLVDKWGRRPILLVGAIGMCISQLIVAITGTVSTGQYTEGADIGKVFVKDLATQKVAIAFVCIYIFFFASTWGPLAWVVTGEIFPLRTRAMSLSLTTATNWLLNWAIAFATPYLTDYGAGSANLQSKIFFVWFGACFLCIAFVYFLIYETKDLTLEEVDLLYEDVKFAPKSTSWTPPKESWQQRKSIAEQHSSKANETNHEGPTDHVEGGSPTAGGTDTISPTTMA